MRQYQALVGGSWRDINAYEFDRGRLGVISNARPTQQRMVKQTIPWTLTAERSVNGEQVWAKKTKAGVLLMGVPGDGGKIRRVSAQYVYSGTHPAKKIYKRKPGVNPRAAAKEYIKETGVTRKAHQEGMRRFKSALTAYGRRKDRRAADQPFNTDPATYDPLTQDMPGVDDIHWNDHQRWRHTKGVGMGWVANKYRDASAAVAASKARKEARIAAGIPLKRAPNGRGKGAFPAYVKAHFHAVAPSVPMNGLNKRQHAQEVIKVLAARYKASHANSPAPGMVLDPVYRKRNRDDDDNDAVYDPEIFRGNLPGVKRKTY